MFLFFSQKTKLNGRQRRNQHRTQISYRLHVFEILPNLFIRFVVIKQLILNNSTDSLLKNNKYKFVFFPFFFNSNVERDIKRHLNINIGIVCVASIFTPSFIEGEYNTNIIKDDDFFERTIASQLQDKSVIFDVFIDDLGDLVVNVIKVFDEFVDDVSH